MKPTMITASQRKQRQKLHHLAKAMKVGCSNAEMWLTNRLAKIRLQVVGNDGAVECRWSRPINSVVLSLDGTMTVYTYDDNVPMIELPKASPGAWYGCRPNARLRA